MHKSGFVAVIGRPNVGKSTLLNKVMGEKLTIISDKPQTTRNKIQLIYTEDDLQIVFLDTPGMQSPRNKLGEYMLKISRSTFDDVDVITYIVDDSDFIGKMDSQIIKELENIDVPIILVINKADKLSGEELDKIKAMYAELDMFVDIISISALENENVDGYIGAIKSQLEEGPQYYPEDMITDQPERNIVAEIVREKALRNLQEEVPHGIYVEITQMRQRGERQLMDVHGTIFCEKESHKGIVIGKGGKMLQKIGSSARADIEDFLDIKVNLQLWVKVAKDWREKENKVKHFGYE